MDLDPSNIDPTYAGVFKIFVEKEKAGFEQCRDEIEKWLIRRINELNEEAEYFQADSYTGGWLAGLREVLEYVTAPERFN
jgi:hypothetical protein